MCEYPPPSPGLGEEICLSEAWPEYLNCYTQNKDNTQCCLNNGVNGDYQICLDMCHGDHQSGESVGTEHAPCEDISDAISRCNHDNLTREQQTAPFGNQLLAANGGDPAGEEEKRVKKDDFWYRGGKGRLVIG